MHDIFHHASGISPMMNRKARIICTIGPASADKRVIRGLVHGGMDAARLNFSHGDYAFHEEAFNNIRREAQRLKKTVAIVQDLQGIKVRVGTIQGRAVELKKGQIINIMAGRETGDGNTIFINYPPLIRSTDEGMKILLDDGRLELKIVEKGRNALKAKVKVGGVFFEKKGVNIPGLRPLDVSSTKKDALDMLFGLKLGVDYTALSYVRIADDVCALKNFLKKNGSPDLPVIAKIETPQALLHIEEILEQSEGIMIARGDLGVEIAPESGYRSGLFEHSLFTRPKIEHAAADRRWRRSPRVNTIR